jgi:hypothetical protein
MKKRVHILESELVNLIKMWHYLISYFNLTLERLWHYQPITHTVKKTILNCNFFLYDQVFIYTYNRHVSRLQKLISLTENRKLCEWIVPILTCELCFIQSYLTRDERGVKRTNKFNLDKVRILECELSFQFTI